MDLGRVKFYDSEKGTQLSVTPKKGYFCNKMLDISGQTKFWWEIYLDMGVGVGIASHNPPVGFYQSPKSSKSPNLSPVKSALLSQESVVYLVAI